MGSLRTKRVENGRYKHLDVLVHADHEEIIKQISLLFAINVNTNSRV